MNTQDLRAQCEISLDRTWGKGGQHVGTDPCIITIFHGASGIRIVLPPQGRRSQHMRVQAGLDALLYLLEAA